MKLRITYALLSLLTIGPLLVTLSPSLANAATLQVVNMPKYGDASAPLASCVVGFSRPGVGSSGGVTALPTTELISRNSKETPFYKSLNSAEKNFVNSRVYSGNPGVVLGFGPSASQASVPINGGANNPDTNGNCATQTLVQVCDRSVSGCSESRWIGITKRTAVVGTSYIYGLMDAKTTDGRTLTVRFGSGGQGADWTSSFSDVLQASPTLNEAANTGGGNVLSGANIQAEWLDVSRIKVTYSGTITGTEIFEDSQWDRTSDYFMVETSIQNRKPLEYASLSGAKKCAIGPNDCDPLENSAPFIRPTTDSRTNLGDWQTLQNADSGINFRVDGSDNPVERFNKNLNALSSRKLVMYNYDAEGNALFTIDGAATDAKTAKRTGTTIPRSQIANLDMSKVWFVSGDSTFVIPVFQTGEANERSFIASYDRDGTTNNYAENSPKCAVIALTGAPSANGTPAEWTLKKASNGQCATPANWGKADVRVKKDATRTEGLVQSQSDINTGDLEPEINCDISINPLTWLVCPMVDAAQGAVAQLDDTINTLLDVDTNRIFDTEGPYYDAWNVMRIFGIAIVIILGMVMILAQVSGIELFDAYMIKKVMPRLVIAVIGMSLSWYLMRLFVDFSNDLGQGIRSIIYAPFSETGENFRLDGGSSAVMALVGGGAALALGIFGLLSFAVTALLAVFVGLFILVLRELLIIMLIMTAPVAIALSILPNTQKTWNLWKETFMKALMLYPIIAAFIAVGRVFAVTASNADPGGTVNQLIAFIAYFAPYFMIATAFRLAGGAVATIGGLANDRTRGTFDRLKKYRAGQADARIGHKMDNISGQVLQARTGAYKGLMDAAGSRKGVRAWALRGAAKQAAGFQGRQFGGNIDAAMSARNAAEAKLMNDQIANGDDTEIRALTVDKNWLSLDESGRQALAGQELAEKRGDSWYFKSLGGKMVSESAVHAAYDRWGNNNFAQANAAAYEMRKASTDDEVKGLASRYGQVAQNSWGMSDRVAGSAWVGGAFQNAEKHLAFKHVDWKNGDFKGNGAAEYASEVYENKNSYQASQLNAHSIEMLEKAYAHAESTGDIETMQKIQGVSETFMSRFGSQQGSAAAGQATGQQTTNTSGTPPGQDGNFQTVSSGSAHTNEAIHRLARRTGVYRDLPKPTAVPPPTHPNPDQK